MDLSVGIRNNGWTVSPFYRSFFSPKSGKGSSKGETKPDSRSTTTEKMALGDLNSDSPTFKRRAGRKRPLLTDSDSENDEGEEGKLSTLEETSTSKSEGSEGGKEASSSAQLEIMVSPKKSILSSLAIKSPLKTPPKRATGKPLPVIDQFQLPSKFTCNALRNMTCL